MRLTLCDSKRVHLAHRATCPMAMPPSESRRWTRSPGPSWCSCAGIIQRCVACRCRELPAPLRVARGCPCLRGPLRGGRGGASMCLWRTRLEGEHRVLVVINNGRAFRECPVVSQHTQERLGGFQVRIRPLVPCDQQEPAITDYGCYVDAKRGAVQTNLAG